MKVIPDWQEKQLRCYFCGETRSVKYIVEVKNQAYLKQADFDYANKFKNIYGIEIVENAIIDAGYPDIYGNENGDEAVKSVASVIQTAIDVLGFTTKEASAAPKREPEQSAATANTR